MTVKTIAELTDGEWVDIEVTVKQLWDNDNDSIRQVGIFTDDTGIVKFVSWTKSGLPLLQEGMEYVIRGVPVSSYGDRLQVALVSGTNITRVSPDASAEPEIPTV